MVRVVGKFGLGVLLAPIGPIRPGGPGGWGEGLVRTILRFLVAKIKYWIDVERLIVMSTAQYHINDGSGMWRNMQLTLVLNQETKIRSM